MIQQLYDHADQNGGELKERTFFILDEFANIGKIPDFDKKISTSRSRKISFSVILQNIDQLEAVYEKSYETIMGNCDTHVFLGSNSYKTVEYFSKALGEKTIGRDSISINRDRQNWKTGKSVSDQIMARPLMTPDELRRMDNDQCIIYEKGIKPVKAPKFYYFKHPMARKMASLEISHNDIGEKDRGVWRKYNPYNPYVEEKDNKKEAENLKVESLDDLFDDIPELVNNKEEKTVTAAVGTKTGENKLAQEEKIEAIEKPKLSLDLDDFQEDENIAKEIEAPMLPQEEEDIYDLQKELEAKFDELFGPID